MRMVGDSSSSIIAAMVSGFEYSSQYSLITNLPSSSSALLLPNLSMPSPSELSLPAPAPVPLPPPQPHPPHPSELSPHKSAAGQWGAQETRDFIAVRARLEKEFRQRKRNKLLWDAVAARMRDLGYRRTAEQCKCKWKNLVNRYKGKETSEAADDGRQFAFFDDMQAIFVERAKTSNKHLLESDQPQHTAMPVPMPRRKRKKPRKGGERSSEEILSLEEEEDDEDDDDEEDVDEEEEEAESVEEERAMAMSKKRKQKAERERQRATAERSRAKSMKEGLEEFLEQQQRLEMEWKEGVERRERERRAREQSWREEMEALENERIQREQAWREREEQRRAKEEERAMQRDSLFSALLLRLARDNV